MPTTRQRPVITVTPPAHRPRLVCTCGDSNCASLDGLTTITDRGMTSEMSTDEWLCMAHLRTWCHDGSKCPICKEQTRAYKAERALDQIIEG